MTERATSPDPLHAAPLLRDRGTLRADRCPKTATSMGGPVLLSMAIGLATLLIAISSSNPIAAADLVAFRRDDQTRHIAGKIVAEAVDGGLLVLAPDGMLWDVQPGEIVSRRQDEAPFEPLQHEALARELLAELPAGFQVHTTAHYVICHNTSRAYAQWVGGLFERLHRGYFTYWGQKAKVAEPGRPLAAIIFENQAAFVAHARREVGDSAEAMLGYYSLRTNRVVMYDLTGVQAVRQPGSRRGSPAEINQLLSAPAAERTVATIIHEATHQLTFNSGLLQRYADIPLWWNEGLAMYFETPDLATDKGWRTIGAVNRVQLAQFHDYLRRRPAGSLATLLVDAARFRSAQHHTDAYAESWALHYFLARRRPEQYLQYLKLLSGKPPAVQDKPEERLAEFVGVFGDLAKLEQEFLRAMAALK